MAIPDDVVEIKELRRQELLSREWGAGTAHTRVFQVPKGKLDSYFTTYFAEGTVIDTKFIDHAPGSDPDAPMVSAARQWRDHQNGQMVIEATYIEVDALEAFSNEYAETRRIIPRDNQLGAEYVLYGIAASTTSSGIPDTGDYLDGGSGNFDPICRDVHLDDFRLPGRVLVRSVWTGLVDYSAS